MLTFFSDSLKSNCFLTLLGCVSPYKKDYGETLSTLTFVSEAKSIKKTPYLNELIKEFQVSEYFLHYTMRSQSILSFFY